MTTRNIPLTWNDYREWLGDLGVGEPPAAPAPPLAAWSTDSRTIAKGQWFVPIAGESFDGHKFIEAAVQRGATGFFYDRAKEDLIPAAIRPLGYRVTDSLAAFQHIACGWRTTLTSLKLLAMTGSTGKTTTKEMLAHILRKAGPTYATQASFNNEIGVPKTLQGLTPEHRYAALEFGARMTGNIRFLCSMAAPDVVGLLNVGLTHVGVFGSVQALLNTKLEIFRNSPDHAVQVAFADDPRIVAGAIATGKPVVTFGTERQADVRVLGSDWREDDGTMTVRLSLQGREVTIPFGVAHAVFAINAAAAAAMAIAAEVPDSAIISGLTGFSGVKGRYQVHRLGGLTLVDDTYNANPDSMRAGLGTVGRSFKGKRVVLVLGDMLELGDVSPKEHWHVGAEYVAPLSPALLVTVGKDAHQLAEGAVSKGVPKGQVKSFDSVTDVLKNADTLLANADVVYAKASNGIKLSLLVDQLLAGAAR